MCGIVGYIGRREALPVLLEGLKRLEYRGYDSAGIATLSDEGRASLVKEVGKVSNLEQKIDKKTFEKAALGIAHTRWATHGKPSTPNAHPHLSQNKQIYLVHNGIIENYQQLKQKLEKKGYKFKSQTDSEVLAHLIEDMCTSFCFIDAVTEALKLVQGTYGIAVFDKNNPKQLVVARKGSPLILGVGENEYIVASDACAIVNYTREVVYLEDDEIAEITPEGFRVFRLDETMVNKKISKLDWSMEKVQKEGFDHFMIKEIFQEPTVINNATMGRIDRFIKEDGLPLPGGLKPVERELRRADRIIIVSCGTSYYAGLIGKYMIEEYAGIPVEVDYASEFRYRKPIINKDTVVIAISQSGETADTLEAIREAKYKGATVIGVVNVVGSTIARETDGGIYTHAGPEIGVASTKAFMAQLSALVLITLTLGRQRQMSFVMGKRIAKELIKIPALIKKILNQKAQIKKIAKKYQDYNNWLFLGRKYNYPIAMEGALKLKEISYVHAEGYAAGEMKHGPIAMIDKNFPSFFIATSDSVYEKVVSGMEEIKARGGKMVAIATVGNREIKKIADDVIYIPKTLEMLTPMLTVIPMQLFAYFVGTGLGHDVDKPRNLAKSVTVE